MRHRVATKQFNRDTKARQGLLKGLVRSLVEEGSITTTVAKAKEVRRIADKLIGKAKQDTVSTRRTLHTFFGKRDVVNTLIERVAPLFASRNSGFTRIVKLGNRRGDNTPVATLSLVVQPDQTGLKKATVKAKTAKAEKAVKAAKTEEPIEKEPKTEKKSAAAAPAVAAPKVQKIAATRAGGAKRAPIVRKTGER